MTNDSIHQQYVHQSVNRLIEYLWCSFLELLSSILYIQVLWQEVIVRLKSILGTAFTKKDISCIYLCRYVMIFDDGMADNEYISLSSLFLIQLFS